MHLLKKMGVIFTFATLASSSAIYAHHSHHSHHSHHFSQNEHHIEEQLDLALHSIVNDLNLIFAEFGTAGVNATTLALEAAYNVNDIAPKAAFFGATLAEAGVDATIAQNVVNQLDFYAVAAENYANAFYSGGDVAGALAAWNAQTLNLINALDAIPHVKGEQLAPLVLQLEQAEIATVQNYNLPANYPVAIQQNNQAHVYAEQIARLIAKALVRG